MTLRRLGGGHDGTVRRDENVAQKMVALACCRRCVVLYSNGNRDVSGPRRASPEMTMHPVVSSKREALAELCRRFHVRRLDVFGSAARGADFDALRSDADFLIEFEPGRDPGMAGFMDLKQAMEHAIGRSVDLLDRSAVAKSRNYIRRRQILSEAEPVYVAG